MSYEALKYSYVIERNPVIDAEQEILELERLLQEARGRLRHENVEEVLNNHGGTGYGKI